MLKSRTQSIRLWPVDDEKEVIRQYDSMRTSLVLKLEASSGLDKGWNVSPRVEEPGTTLGPQKQYMPTPLDEDHHSTPTASLERVATSICAIAAPQLSSAEPWFLEQV